MADSKTFDESHPNWRPRGALGQFEKQGPSAGKVGFETPPDAGRVRRNPMVELGATGLRHWGGVIDEEFLPALRGRRATRIYSEMKENDPTVGAMLFAIEMLIRNVEWRVEPGSDQPIDHELAQFVDSCRNDMQDTWHDTLASILSFLPFGFSIHEEVYKRRDGIRIDDDSTSSKYADGRIGWRKLPVRAQDTVHRWWFDETRGDQLRGVVQLPPPNYQFFTIPTNKLMLFRTTAAKANPEGRSVLRNAYRPWYFKKRIETIEGIGVERDLAGLPKMEVPPELLDANADAETKALAEQFRKMLRDVRRDEREGILIPRQFDDQNNPMYSFELVRSGGRRQFDTTAIVNRYDRLIASTVLADFIFLGQHRVGALSLGESKTELFGFALGAWLDSITQLFNRVGIPRLLGYNGIRSDTPPKLTHGDVETVDLGELGDYIAKLAGAGMPLFPDDEIENQLRLQGGLPKKKEDLERFQEEEEKEAERLAAQERAAAEAEAERLRREAESA